MVSAKDRTNQTPHFDTLLAGESRLGTLLRLLLLLSGLMLLRSVHGGSLSRGAIWALRFYVAIIVAIPAAVMLRLAPAMQRFWPDDLSRALLLGASIADLVFVSLLVFHSGGPLSDASLLYPLLLLRAATLYPALPEIATLAVLCGPAYAGVLYLQAGGWFFLTQPYFIWRYLALLAASLGGLGLGWTLAGYQRRLREAEAHLRSNRSDMARQTLTLQQTADDLSRRVQQLRMLQEGIKAINSSLALEDLLTLIVTNAAQVVREAHCSLALLDEDSGYVTVRALSDLPVDRAHVARLAASEGIARWVVRHGIPARIDRTAGDVRLGGTHDPSVASLISVPLTAGGTVLGALTATAPEEAAFSDEDLEGLAAFAAQAVSAVENARLYQSVQQRHRELEAMLRGIGDAIVATDSRLRLTMLNPIAAHVFDVRPGVAAGQPLPEVIDNPDLVALSADALTGAEASLIREFALPPGPGERPPSYYQALASPVRGERGEVRGVVIVLRDITEQRELDRVKSDFLSVVSHELKTPLHSIKGFVDIILMGKAGPITATQRDFLGTVKQQADALQSMINDLLEFSRLEAGRIRLRIERLLLGQLVRGVVARLEPLAAGAGLALINQVPGDLGVISADAARIEQVVTNLLYNAIKFTPQGSVTISAVDLGEEVKVTVTDTGIGIAADQLERIFQRFYQVDGTATRSYRGAGLGLTICRHIVEYHGGRIWVESTQGWGSSFHFVLPKHQPNPDAPAIDFAVLPPGRS